MSTKPQVKPFRLDDCKKVNGRLPDTTIAKWRGLLMSYIQKETEWKFIHQGSSDDKKWDKATVEKRGLTDDKKVEHINAVLEFIAQYAPSCLYRDITIRSKSLKEVWETQENYNVRPLFWTSLDE